MDRHEEELTRLTAQRWRVALGLSAAVVVIYFGFMLLVSLPATKAKMASEIVPGLSVGILLGASVIVLSWLLTFIYIRWANAVYDPKVRELQAGHRSAASNGGAK